MPQCPLFYIIFLLLKQYAFQDNGFLNILLNLYFFLSLKRIITMLNSTLSHISVFLFGIIFSFWFFICDLAKHILHIPDSILLQFLLPAWMVLRSGKMLMVIFSSFPEFCHPLFFFYFTFEFLHLFMSVVVFFQNSEHLLFLSSLE